MRIIRFVAAPGVAAMVAMAVGLSPGVLAAIPPGYTVSNVGAYGGEPSIVSDNLGRLYDTTPSGGTITYTSIDKSLTLQKVTPAHPSPRHDLPSTHHMNAAFLFHPARR